MTDIVPLEQRSSQRRSDGWGAPDDRAAPDTRAAPDDRAADERRRIVADPDGGWPVLLVEDDDGDAILVQALLDEIDAPIRLMRARTVAQALELAAVSRCVLLDLGLPDSSGLSALSALIEAAPAVAVVVLTGLRDEHRGAEAVAAGAQDYLVKDQVDGRGLLRAVRYAIERKYADETARELRESALRAEEKARLERGLLPRPLVDDPRLGRRVVYQPGHRQALLGGDFYDMVEKDGVVHVLLGDVCGHDPDAAALGASLRIAWRTLVLAGVAEADRLDFLQEVLVSERDRDELFATVCTLAISQDRTSARMRLAGHPPPARLTPSVEQLVSDEVGPALGVLDEVVVPAVDVELGSRWTLLLATDGLLEGRDGPGGEPLGWEGVLPEVGRLLPTTGPFALLEPLIHRVEERNEGPLTDDVALLVLVWDPPV